MLAAHSCCQGFAGSPCWHGAEAKSLQLLLNLLGAIAWPTAALNPWPNSCIIFCGKYTSSSSGYQHPGNQGLVGSDTPTWVPVRNRCVPLCPCGFQLILTCPHFTSIFPLLMLAFLSSGPTTDCLTSSSDYIGTNPYNKSLLSNWTLTNTQCYSRWTDNLRVGSLNCFWVIWNWFSDLIHFKDINDPCLQW